MSAAAASTAEDVNGRITILLTGGRALCRMLLLLLYAA
jgi:hypothetical protein